MLPSLALSAHICLPLLQHLGVNVDTLLLCQPDSGEMALEVADSLIRCASVILF